MIPVILAILATPPAPLTPDQLHAAVEAAPRDVKAFILRRTSCLHWGGEGPSGIPERDAQINKAMRDLRCTSIPQDERKLRAKYAKSPTMLKLIDDTKDELPW